MTAPLLPELGDAPPLTCSRVGCTRDAEHHVIHNVGTMANGLVCAVHLVEFAYKGWRYDAVHPYRLDCSHPNAMYHPDANLCTIPVTLKSRTTSGIAYT